VLPNDMGAVLDQTQDTIDACVIVGGTLITLHFDQLHAAAQRGVRIRFLFPVPDSPWLAPMIEAAGMTPAVYGQRIIANAEKLTTLPGVQLRWYSMPSMSWFTISDTQRVAHKPFSFLRRAEPVVTDTTDAVRYYTHLYEHMWDAATQARLHPNPPADPSPAKRLRVFICHSSLDKDKATHLYDELAAEGYEPWLDTRNLLPGQDWRHEIKGAIGRCGLIIVCLSRAAIPRPGYMQKEIIIAHDIADLQPEGTIFVIPVQLDDCDIPERLAHLHTVDISQPAGHNQLFNALKLRAAAI